MPAPAPEILAAGLAARLIHDLAGAASGVTAGLELFRDTDIPALRDEGLDLATSSGEALLNLLAFCRTAFGTTDEPKALPALEALARTQFTGRRAQLAWPPDTTPLTGAASAALLVLVQIAAGGLAMGGVAQVTVETDDATVRLRVDGEGRRAKLQPEALEGLGGQALSSGLAGRWAPASYARALVTGAGGEVTASERDGGFTLEARLPN